MSTDASACDECEAGMHQDVDGQPNCLVRVFRPLPNSILSVLFFPSLISFVVGRVGVLVLGLLAIQGFANPNTDI